MSDFSRIEGKARQLAEMSGEMDDILKSVQVAKTVGEMRPWTFNLMTLVPLLAVVLTGVALVVQAWQFRLNAEQQREAAEDSQWRDAIKNLSIETSSKLLTGVFELQSFFRSRYGKPARSIAVALLPRVQDEGGFDVVFGDLVDLTQADDQADLISVGRSLSNQERGLFQKALQIWQQAHGNQTPPPKFVDFVIDPSPYFSEDNAEQATLLTQALSLSWRIETVSADLGNLWQKRATVLTPADQDLSLVILQGVDVHGVDFSGAVINGVVFDNAQLAGTVFDGVTKFSDSEWDGANWWDARSMSCELANDLNKRYHPSNDKAKTSSEALLTACTR
jgi:uncharacterized protein YjbI with pentapeptide repeats/cell division protein FtsL